MKKPTLSDIAKKLNISVVTVSKALNNQNGVSESLKRKIKQTAFELGYKGVAVRREITNTKLIAIIIPERFVSKENLNHSFYFNFIQEITMVLQKKGYNSVLHILKKYEEDNDVIPNILLENKVNAVILLAELKTAYIEHLMSIDFPMVCVDFYGKNLDTNSIVTDNYHCSYEISCKLIEMGHKYIGFVGKLQSTTSIQDRFLGYQKALIEHRLEFNKEWLISDRDEEGTFIDMDLPENLPTAFVCNSDRAAYELIKTLNSKGFKVPDDISVVGFDNDIFSVFSSPKITTFQVNIPEMSMKAVDFILQKIYTKNLKLGKLPIKGILIERDSVKDLNKE